MNTLKIADFKVTHESIVFNDYDLMKQFNKLRENILEKKHILDMRLKNSNETDYLSTAIAKLDYGFTKEEYDVLFDEILKRGLITN